MAANLMVTAVHKGIELLYFSERSMTLNSVCFCPDCEIQEERSTAGHMDVVETLQEGETIEVKSNSII